MTTAWSDAGDIFHYELDDSIIIGYPTAPTLREGSIPIRDDDNDQKIVYHFEEPFCSFLSSSVKPSIFSPKKMIVRRNRKGKVRQGPQLHTDRIVEDMSSDSNYLRINC